MTALPELKCLSLQSQQGIVICLARKVGFFALFFQVLGHIYHAEKAGLVPVVFFGSSCLYWSENGYTSRQGNAWEYYFEPISALKVEEIFQESLDRLIHASIHEYSEADITHNPPEEYSGELRGSILVPTNVKVTNCWADFDPGQEAIYEDRRAVFHDLITRRVRIIPSIQGKIEQFYQASFTESTVIGVHMRGTERSVEVMGWYQKRHLDERTYMWEVDRILKKTPNAQIFLATDTQTTVEKFRERYGDRLITYDARRSDEGQSPHLQFGGAVLGEQVLIESIMLSRTNFLIHGISNVAFAALCFNPTLEHLNVYSTYGKSKALKMTFLSHVNSAIQRLKYQIRRVVK